MKDTPCIIFSIGDTACEIIGTYQIIFANVTFFTTSDWIVLILKFSFVNLKQKSSIFNYFKADIML